MNECINCKELFRLDASIGLLGQDKCPECSAKAWQSFLKIIKSVA